MQVLIPILIYGGVGLLLLCLAIVLYLFARSSRKSYSCPECGERITTEYLNARRCGMCGAELRREM